MALPTDPNRPEIRTGVMKRNKCSAETMIKYHAKTKKLESFHIGQNMSISLRKKQRKGTRLPGVIVNKSVSAQLHIKLPLKLAQ